MECARFRVWDSTVYAWLLIGTLRSSDLYQRAGNAILNIGFGLVMIGFGTIAIWISSGHGPGTIFYLSLVITGFGQGFLQPSTVRIVLAEIEPQRAGLAAGAVMSVLQTGAAFGVAGIGSVFFVVLGSREDGTGYGYAFAAALATIAVIDCAGMLLAIGLNRRHARHAARNLQSATSLAIYREAP
jgi:hypothetical protein